MDLMTKIRMACTYRGISQAELARRCGWTPANLNQRLVVGKFTQEELRKIGEALGGVYVAEFRFEDGTVI